MVAVMAQAKNGDYRGFEQGPIRPPSEAHSLLIRVTRNCPWNRCTFCPVYKGAKFSLRPVEHVKRDIDAVFEAVTALREDVGPDGEISRQAINALAARLGPHEAQAYSAALHWLAGGMRSVFLQDANSLIIKPADLVEILLHLRDRFPSIERITSYARSHTVSRIDDEDMAALARAGLNRIHIGMESGSDEVLRRVHKGVDKARHIDAGQKVKRAGIELSEYHMPGLGGRELSHRHAVESADVMNQINPDFIRLRSLAIPQSVPLFEQWQAGTFDKCTDSEIVQELLTFLGHVDGIDSFVRSDHILNLFEDLEGKLPEDRERMTDVLRRFLAMPPDDQTTYQVGRRVGLFRGLDDLDDDAKRGQVEALRGRMAITPQNVDAAIDELMARFI